MRVRFLVPRGSQRGARWAGPFDAPGPRSRRRVGAAVVLVGLVGGSLLPLAAPAGAAPAPVAAVRPAEHGTGLQPTATRLGAANGLANARRIGAVKTALSLPAAVDLTPYAATPGDQGQVGSCVGWSTGYTLLGWYANYQKHAGAPFAPMYVYSQINGGRDAGATIPSAWNILESQGVAEQSVYTQGNYNWSTKPTAAQTTNAAQHKTLSHTYLFNGPNQGVAAQTAMQAALAGNGPVVIGIPVHSGFGALSQSNQVWRLSDTNGKSLLGYHAIVAVGYDSTGIRIENSWGTGWGAAGFATLAWDFVNRWVFEASVGTGFVQTNQPVPPKVTKLSSTTLSSKGGQTLTITGTQMSTVDATATGAARLVNVTNPAVTAALTVTAATPTTLTVTTPAVPVQGAYRVVLTNPAGTSSTTEAAATVTVLAPYDISVDGAATALSTGGSKITLIGSGFGGTQAAFNANTVTATVAAKSAPVTWVSDSRVQLTMPAGTVGSVASIVLMRAGIGSTPVTVTYLPPPPAVTAISPATVSTAGGTVTVAVAGVATVSSTTTTVRLVNVANPNVTGTGTITARSAAGLTVALPAVPTDGNGTAVPGAYRLGLTGAGGASTATGTTDQVSYVPPFTISVPAGSLVSAAGGTALTVSGTGFGASSAAFGANKVTATVNAATAPVTWLSDTRVTVTVPAGTAGAPASVVLLRNGVASPADSNARYAAVITASSQLVVPTAGAWMTTLTGVGFAKSTGWALTDSAGNAVASLPVAANRDALNAAASGVLLISPTQVLVKLPAAPAGRPGAYSLTFTPDRGTYSTAVSAFTSKAVVIYSNLG